MTVEAGYPFFLDEGESFSNLCASQDGHFLYLVTDKGNLLFFDKIAGKVVRKFKYSINPSANATTIMSEGEYIWVSSIVGGVTRLHIPTENLIIISIMRMPGCLLYHIQMRMGWLHWIMILTLQ